LFYRITVESKYHKMPQNEKKNLTLITETSEMTILLAKGALHIRISSPLFNFFFLNYTS